MYKISKQFTFSASHQLSNLPPDHQCARLHGHNYTVIITLQSQKLNEVGFVVDYGELKPLKEYIDSTLDHRHLNDILPVSPTAEHLARWLYNWCKAKWPETISITVKETEKTSAEYSE